MSERIIGFVRGGLDVAAVPQITETERRQLATLGVEVYPGARLAKYGTLPGVDIDDCGDALAIAEKIAETYGPGEQLERFVGVEQGWQLMQKKFGVIRTPNGKYDMEDCLLPGRSKVVRVVDKHGETKRIFRWEKMTIEPIEDGKYLVKRWATKDGRYYLTQEVEKKIADKLRGIFMQESNGNGTSARVDAYFQQVVYSQQCAFGARRAVVARMRPHVA